jgi:release factor glutamine methyltransferase
MRATIQYIKEELQGTWPENEIKEFIKLIFWEIKNYSFTDLYLKQDELLTGEERDRVYAMVSRLKKSEPIQYVVGKTEFYGLLLHISAGVLIPRPETEEMAQWIISEQKSPPGVILDIGTGSGCLALALKKAFPSSTVLGYDISEKSIHLARKNSLHNSLDIGFFQSDIFRWRESRDWLKSDIVVSNPPYVTEFDKIHLRKNVIDFEPSEALFVPDPDPLLYYRHIAEFSAAWLNKEGRVYFEVNELYGNDVVRLLANLGFSGIELRKDFRGKDRMVRAILNKDNYE